MEFLVEKTFTIIFGALLTGTWYWAKTTKDDLKESDARIERDLKRDHTSLDVRLKTVESGINDNKVSLAEIKGEIKLLSSGIGVYREEKHRVDNENAGLRGSLVECTEALKAAERVLLITDRR